MADKIVDLITLAGVFAMLALPLAVMCCWTLIGINRRRSRALKEVLAKNVQLSRRLADVEALRAKDRKEDGA